jgi:hypothetical protein
VTSSAWPVNPSCAVGGLDAAASDAITSVDLDRVQALGGPDRRSVLRVLALLAILLVVWLILAVLGFVIKGLFWLAILGIVLFLATAAYGAVKRRATGAR